MKDGNVEKKGKVGVPVKIFTMEYDLSYLLISMQYID